jgi:hypothetical protein
MRLYGTVANGILAIAWRVFSEHFNQPLDGGIAFVDKQPIFGHSKTILGNRVFSPVVRGSCNDKIGRWRELAPPVAAGGVALVEVFFA